MNRSARLGFTLIETLVVIALLMILLGLLLPALGSAVESARSLHCRAKLHQLALASHAYHDTHGTLPAWNTFTDTNEPSQNQAALESNLSVHAQILPFLEGSAVYELINHQVATYGDNWRYDLGFMLDQTAARTRVPAFLCPSDASDGFPAGNSYRACLGAGPHWHRLSLFPDSANGLFGTGGPGQRYPLRLSRATDGLGNTAMWSERLLGGNGGEAFDPGRDVLLQGGMEAFGVASADDELRLCALINSLPEAGHYGLAGKYWIFSGQHHTLYTHCLPPNSGIADCLVFGFTAPMGAGTARSMHAATVNVAFGSGAVSPVSETVELRVWRALATCDGHEAVLDGAY